MKWSNNLNESQNKSHAEVVPTLQRSVSNITSPRETLDVKNLNNIPSVVVLDTQLTPFFTKISITYTLNDLWGKILTRTKHSSVSLGHSSERGN